MNDEIKEWLDAQAKNYKQCILAVLKNIPPKLSDDMTLAPGDLKDIAGSLFIQGHKAGVFRTEDGGAAPPRYEDDKPISPGQTKFIKNLAKELGKDGDDIVDQHLRIAGVKTVDALSMSEGRELIKKMKQEKLNRNKP